MREPVIGFLLRDLPQNDLSKSVWTISGHSTRGQVTPS
jgi:hypothetical protein